MNIFGTIHRTRRKKYSTLFQNSLFEIMSVRVCHADAVTFWRVRLHQLFLFNVSLTEDLYGNIKYSSNFDRVYAFLKVLGLEYAFSANCQVWHQLETGSPPSPEVNAYISATKISINKNGENTDTSSNS